MFGILKKMFAGQSADLSEIVKQGAFLVDVRSPAEFASGNVKGSVNIPLDQIKGQLHQFKGKNHIVVFCKSGMRSSQAKALLERNGVDGVTNGGNWQTIQALISK